MSRKDERIAALEEKVADLELARVNLRAEARAAIGDAREIEKRFDQEREVFAAMLVRAAREIGELRARASFLEDIESMVPGTLDGLGEDLQPKALRARIAAIGGPK